MPPRRPDPETGLMPDVAEVGYASSPVPEFTYDDVPRPRRGRSLSDMLVTRTAAVPAAPSIQVNARRDMARQGVTLELCAYPTNDAYGRVSIMESINWRDVSPGEIASPTPIFIDERVARDLATQLGEFHPEMRRMERMREQLDNAQNEVRSLMNQLEECREHKTTLVRVNEEQQRQIRWLERELRDSNRDRRLRDATPLQILSQG